MTTVLSCWKNNETVITNWDSGSGTIRQPGVVQKTDSITR